MDKTVRCVFFDLGNVLVDVMPERLESSLIKHCSAAASPGEIVGYFERSRDMALYTEGKIDSSRFYARIRRRFRLKGSFTRFYELWNDIFRINDSVCALVGLLRERYPDVLLGILSNTNETHYAHLEKDMSVLGRFDLSVLSCSAHAQKPHSAIYARALREAGLPAKDCFFTDDLEANIKAARKAGMRAFRFTDERQLRGDLARCGLPLD